LLIGVTFESGYEFGHATIFYIYLLIFLHIIHQRLVGMIDLVGVVTCVALAVRHLIVGDARVLVWGVQEMCLWRGSGDDHGGGYSKYLTTFFLVVLDALPMRHHGLLWLFLHGVLVFGRLGTCPIEQTCLHGLPFSHVCTQR
jgi:hypothetical protein